ncbi:hypothetical protein BH09CHL1_BH09CHL1_19970 [soil metagenome]
MRLVAEEVDGRRIAIVDGPIDVEPTNLTAIQTAMVQQAILAMCSEFFSMNPAQRLEQLGTSARRALTSDETPPSAQMVNS